jgi:hypothetical protein
MGPEEKQIAIFPLWIFEKVKFYKNIEIYQILISEIIFLKRFFYPEYYRAHSKYCLNRFICKFIRKHFWLPPPPEKFLEATTGAKLTNCARNPRSIGKL